MKDKINIGCGTKQHQMKCWLNLDIDPKCKPDVVCNIEKGLPFKNNTFNEVYSAHTLEHIHPDKVRFVISEIIRVCKPEAKVTLFLPYFSHPTTIRTIEHKTPMGYYTLDNIDGFRIVHKQLYFCRVSFPYVQKKWLNSLSKILNAVFNIIPNSFPLFYERFFCWTFPMEEIKFEAIIDKKEEVENYYCIIKEK